MKRISSLFAVAIAASFFSQALQAQNAGPNTVISPPADKVPIGGQSNPTKRDGSDLGKTVEGMTPQEANPKGLQLNDGSFLKEAAISNMAELRASRVAATRATDPRIKEFAVHVVADHERMEVAAKRLAVQKGIQLPTELDAARLATSKRLEKESGSAFDKAYVAQMVKDHEDTVSFFERMNKESTDAQTQAFVAAQLPVLKQHTQTVVALYAAMQAKQ